MKKGEMISPTCISPHTEGIIQTEQQAKTYRRANKKKTKIIEKEREKEIRRRNIEIFHY